MGDLTADFSRDEFRCPCCKAYGMQRETIAKLQQLRSRYGKAIGIVQGGGYRCARQLKGSLSAHGEGRAADLGVPREDLFSLVKLAIGVGFTGLGIKNKKGKWQLHVDDAPAIDDLRPRPWIWTY